MERLKKEIADKCKEEALMRERQRREQPSQEIDKVNAASAIIIGNDLSNPDPVSIFYFLFSHVAFYVGHIDSYI